MGMDGNSIEALFLAPERRRQGGGRMLVGHAIARHPELRVAVNEQNEEARDFYESLGFRVIGRSDVDDQGRPFPLLRMQRGP